MPFTASLHKLFYPEIVYIIYGSERTRRRGAARSIDLAFDSKLVAGCLSQPVEFWQPGKCCSYFNPKAIPRVVFIVLAADRNFFCGPGQMARSFDILPMKGFVIAYKIAEGDPLGFDSTVG